MSVTIRTCPSDTCNADSAQRFGKAIVRNFSVNPAKDTDILQYSHNFRQQIHLSSYLLLLLHNHSLHGHLYSTCSFFGKFCLRDCTVRSHGESRAGAVPEAPSSQPRISAALSTAFAAVTARCLAGNRLAVLISGPGEHLCSCLLVDPHYLFHY